MQPEHRPLFAGAACIGGLLIGLFLFGHAQLTISSGVSADEPGLLSISSSGRSSHPMHTRRRQRSSMQLSLDTQRAAGGTLAAASLGFGGLFLFQLLTSSNEDE